MNYVKIQNMLSGHGARVEDVRFASEILGRNVGIKIDGGIKTLAQAEELLAAGATRLGLTATGEDRRGSAEKRINDTKGNDFQWISMKLSDR